MTLIAQSEINGSSSELIFIGLFFLLVYTIMNEFSMMSIESILQYVHIGKVLPVSSIVIMKNAKSPFDVTLPSQSTTKSPKQIVKEHKKLHSATKVAPWKASSISNLFHNLADTRGLSVSSINVEDSPLCLETIYANGTPNRVSRSHHVSKRLSSISKPTASDVMRTTSVSRMTTTENPLKSKKIIAVKTVEVKCNSVIPDTTTSTIKHLEEQRMTKHLYSHTAPIAPSISKRSVSSTHRHHHQQQHHHPIKRLTSNNRASSIISQENVLLDVTLPRKSPLPTARRILSMQRPSSLSLTKKRRSSSSIAVVTNEEEAETGETINCLYQSQPVDAGDSDDSSDTNAVLSRNASSVAPIGLSNVVGGIAIKDEQKAVFTMLRRVHRNSLTNDRAAICFDPNTKVITPNRIRASGVATNVRPNTNVTTINN